MQPWLERPIAHRGLHNARAGVIENTASAFAAAVEHGYAIETDLQECADGEAIVFHDDDLDRLTEASGPLRSLTVAQLRKVPYRGVADPLWTLGELLDFTSGRAPLLLELKCDAAAAARFAATVLRTVREYRGPVAVMSFEPRVAAAFRKLAPDTPRGLVSMRHTAKDWPGLGRWRRFARTHLLSWDAAQPHFIAYHWSDLRVAAVRRAGMKVPVLAWTVRSESEAAVARRYADNVIFEGYIPPWMGAAPHDRPISPHG
jgi:glycerophosphoryl diester phosphodiesterase